MTAYRATSGLDIEPSVELTFTFDGRPIKACAGDTIASALLANGVQIVGRSFKYHRPRGVWGFGVEEPNAIVDVEGPGGRPNTRATLAAAAEGAIVRSVNSQPSAAHDLGALIDLAAPFIPAGFYYKTFMFPHWRWFEPLIRAMAGLGKVDVARADPIVAEQINDHCDVLVVGGGPAGLAAAAAAAEQGLRVVLCDERDKIGGSLLYRQARIDGLDGRAWVDATLARLNALGGADLAGDDGVRRL